MKGLLFGLWALSGCATVSADLDHAALLAKAQLAQARAPRRRAPQAWPFEDYVQLERRTRPDVQFTPKSRPLIQHRRSARGLVQEELRFPSRVHLQHPESNVAIAYLYRHGPLGERPVVVFAPGLYVSEAAMTPVGWLLDRVLEAGADVLFYVPPYHLGRTPRGWASGDAVLAAELPDHLGVIAQGVADLRQLCAWLRAEGVPAVGGFGGSMGASMLLQVSRMDRSLDFYTGLIPLVRWDDLFLGPPEFQPLRDLVVAQGHDPRQLVALYAELDPAAVPPTLPPERVSLLVAEHDQVARRGPLVAWQRAWGLTRIRTYPRGHSTILLTPAIYSDFSAFLAEDLAAVARPEPTKVSRAPATASPGALGCGQERPLCK